MLCPECGTENDDQAGKCSQCGKDLTAKTQPDEPVVQTNTSDDSEPSVKEEKTAHKRGKPEKPPVSGLMNAIVIIATLIIPLIGFAMGYTYMRKNHPDAKKAGKTWMILGIVMFLLHTLFIGMMK